MTDLLVSSLMADGGLESALEVAFRKETQIIEEIKVSLMVLRPPHKKVFSFQNSTYHVVRQPLVLFFTKFNKK